LQSNLDGEKKILNVDFAALVMDLGAKPGESNHTEQGVSAESQLFI